MELEKGCLRKFNRAVASSGFMAAHTSRHSFASHLLGGEHGFEDHPATARAFRYQNHNDLQVYGSESDEKGNGEPARPLTFLCCVILG